MANDITIDPLLLHGRMGYDLAVSRRPYEEAELGSAGGALVLSPGARGGRFIDGGSRQDCDVYAPAEGQAMMLGGATQPNAAHMTRGGTIGPNDMAADAAASFAGVGPDATGPQGE